MILVVTIAGLSYQMSLNLPASPDLLVLMSHLGDLLLHNCPHSSFLTHKANKKSDCTELLPKEKEENNAKPSSSSKNTHQQYPYTLSKYPVPGTLLATQPQQSGVCRQNISGNSRQAAVVLQEQQQCRQRTLSKNRHSRSAAHHGSATVTRLTETDSRGLSSSGKLETK